METWSVIELIKAGPMNTHRSLAVCTTAADANRPHQCTHAEQARLYMRKASLPPVKAPGKDVLRVESNKGI
jgi:hypothetical protein